MKNNDFAIKRKKMVSRLKSENIILSQGVYQAMMFVPRHLFVPQKIRTQAYEDHPLPIGDGQTISAPHMHAMMCEALQIEKGMKILEVGTGSGYHTALLSSLVGKSGNIYTIERIDQLANKVEKIFQGLELFNIKLKIGDGSQGWPEKAPFDRILVTAACPAIPQILVEQLYENGGRICIPVGDRYFNQTLIVGEKQPGGFKTSKICSVRFVPLIGKYGFEN